MKIAVVIGTFPPHLGGMGAVAFKEANALLARGHQVTVFTLKYPKTDYSFDQTQNFVIKRLWPLVKVGDAGIVPQLSWELENFDVIHFHYPFYGAILPTLVAVIFNKQKLVVTYHMEAKSRGIKKFLQKICDWWDVRLFLNAARKILLVSDYIAKNSKIIKSVSIENPNKLKILPNAVDLKNFSPWPIEMEKVKPQNEKVVLFVGNLLPIKRLDLLLTAFKNLTGVKLVVVGGGYDFENYKNLAKTNGVLDKVSFEGQVNDPRLLNNYYNLSDLVVVPSDYESFSLVALETLACGKPVLISNSVGLSAEILAAQVGKIFTANDAKDLEDKIKEILADPDINNLDKINKRRQFAELYSWDEHMDALENILKETVNK